MQRVFRVVETKALTPVGPKTTNAFNRSVRRFGILNPVLLAEVVDADGVIDLAIIDGNRRVRAARAARLPKIPSVVLKATTEHDRARLTLMCNYMRSANFHTESAAILSLAADEEAAADAARTIGLGPGKMQQLYRKIATMPEPVRQAMYEHRIPVTAARWVGAWPEGLQRELVDLLGRRRYVNTTTVKDLREWYAERHPEEFAVAEPAREDVPFDEWGDTSLQVVEIPSSPFVPESTVSTESERASLTEPELNHAPASPRVPAPSPVVSAETAGPNDRLQDATDSTNVPGVLPGPSIAARAATIGVPESIRSDSDPGASHVVAPAPAGKLDSIQTAVPAREPGSGFPERIAQVSPRVTDSVRSDSDGSDAGAHQSDSGPTGATEVQTASGPGDDRAERMVAFVVRLDGTLRELAREGQEMGIDRSVWVDRAMRAWDRIGQPVGG